ncbi:MAG: hypothetical protein JWO02_4666, partial [Solirubrobacterales bacterium]|nr:hypothetical protein [Solirubrobacterales bacterium]
RPLRLAGAAVGGRLPSGGPVGSTTNRARRLATGLALAPAARYARYMSWFDATQRTALYTTQWRALLTHETPAEDVLAEHWHRVAGGDVVGTMLQVDAATYLPDDLLTKVDIATMAHGLEARSPFLDHELMQFAASIPGTEKVCGSQKKLVLRDALRTWLPDEILDRPKQGFSVPISDWLSGELRGHVRDVLLDDATLNHGQLDGHAVEALLARHDAGAEAEAQRIWSLYMLALWQREFLDAPAQVPAAVGR